MREGFQKFRKRLRLAALTKSLLCGLSFSLLSVGVLMTVLKLKEQPFSPLYYVLIGAGAFLLSFGLCYLICKTNDKKIAKKLDKTLRLREKAQTMYEFRTDEAEMSRVQREDTERRLSEIPVKKITLKSVWAFAVSAALSLAVFITGIALPSVKAEVNVLPSADPFEIIPWQVARLNTLIEDTKKCEIEEPERGLIVTALQTLGTSLYVAETKTNEETGEEETVVQTLVTKAEMENLVNITILLVDGTVEVANTYKTVYNALRTNDSAEVKQIARGLAALNVSEKFDEIIPTFENETQSAVTARTAVNTFVGSLNESLSALTEEVLPAGDGLLAAFTALSAELAEIGSGTNGYERTLSLIAGAFNDAEFSANAVLDAQATNRAEGNYVIDELIYIFDIENPPQTGGEALEGIEGDNKEEDENEQKPAPPGIDDPEYGSDDLVYYPDEERYEKYGWVLQDGGYSSKVTELLQGDIPDELKDSVENYFDILSSGLRGGEDENQAETDEETE